MSGKNHMVWCMANDYHGSKPCNCGASSELSATPCSTADSALANVKSALKLVKDSHIHDNKHRLGALGCADMDMVQEYLESAQGKLLNESSSGTASERKDNQ